MIPIWLTFSVMVFAAIAQTMYNRVFFTDLHERRVTSQLEYNINKASDAAIQQMQDKSVLTPTGSTYLDPNFVWVIYKYTFLTGMDVYSDANMKKCDSMFPAVLIAVDDGYYLRLAVDVVTPVGTISEYRFSQKIPYARTTQVDTVTTGSNNVPLAPGLDPNIIPAGSLVADTMSGKNIWVYKEGLVSASFPRQYQLYQTDGNYLESEVGSAHDLRDINLMLLQALDYTMFYNRNSVNFGGGASKLSIPDDVSETLLSPSVNFVGPTIFAFSDNFYLLGKSYRNYYSVGASQIVHARNVYCYNRNGVNYYSYQDPSTFNPAEGAVLHQIYRSQKEAAIAGYMPDPSHY